MGTANAAFRAHEGVWTVARTQSLGVGPVNEVDTSPSLCVVNVPVDRARSIIRRSGLSGPRSSTIGANSVHAEGLPKSPEGVKSASSTENGANVLTILLVAMGDSVHAFPDDAGPLTKTISFAPCRVTALSAVDDGPLGTSVLVGLSSGDTVALDLVSNCTVAGTRPNNVIALVRPDDVKEGTAVSGCHFIPGINGASQAVVLYRNGTAAVFQVDSAIKQGGYSDSICKPSFGSRKASGIAPLPFTAAGSVMRQTALLKQDMFPAAPGSPRTLPPPSPFMSGKAIAESPLASEGGASYKTASSITGTMSSTLPAWAAIDRSSTSPELLCSSMSPRGEALACGFADGTVGVFDVPRMRLLWGFATYFGAVMSLAWSPDSKVIVAGGQDDLVTMASAVHQKVLCWGEGHRSWVAGVTFDAQMCVLGDHSSANMLNNIYRIVSVGQDGMVAVWDLLMDEDLMDQAEEPGTSDGGLIRPAVARRDMVLLMPVDTFQAHVYPCAAVCLTRLGISSLCVGGLVVSLARPMPGPDAPVHRRAASSSRVCPPGLKQHR